MQINNSRRKNIQRDEENEDIIEGWSEIWGFLDSG